MLRSFGEPISLFGEGPYEVRFKLILKFKSNAQILLKDYNVNCIYFF